MGIISVKSAILTLMSKGLGIWQQRVLNALELSADVDRTPRAERDSKALWHRVYNFDVVLQPHVYDLDVVRFLLAREHGHHDQAVSRAVRMLIRRGELKQLSLVPIQAYERLGYGEPRKSLIHELSDGTYLDYGGRTARFVTA